MKLSHANMCLQPNVCRLWKGMVINMNKFSIITAAKFRKNKGQYITFAIILFIAAAMLNLGLVIQMNFKQSFTDKWIDYNTADVTTIMMKQDYTEDYYNKIKNIKEVDSIEKRDCILMEGSYKLNGSEFSMPNVFYNFDDTINISKLGIIEQKDITSDMPAYVSYYLKHSGYKIGDEYVFNSNNMKYRFTIVGFVEDMTFGTQSLSKLGIYLPNESFKQLKDSIDSSNYAVSIGTILTDRSQSKEVASRITDMLTGKMTATYSCSYYDYCKQVRTMTASVGGMIFIAFSCIIVIVSILISQFRINNDIEEEMQNMGVMKALGYKGNQIIFSTIFAYVVIAGLASILGVGLSYVALPVLQQGFDAQTGFEWIQRFDFIAALITVVIITCLIILASYLTARKIRKLQAIVALRGGVKTHNFRRNYFPIDRSRGNVNYLLAIKDLFANGKKNFLLLLVIMATAFTAIFAGTMYYNIAIKPRAFIEALCETVPSVSFFVADSEDTSLFDEISKDKNVKSVLYYDSAKVIINQEEIRAFITDDYSKMDYSICYEGREPAHNNEIAIGSFIAASGKYKIGDSISVGYGSNKEDFIITGFMQSVNEQGNCIELTTDGIMRLNDQFKKTELNIYLDDESDTEGYIKDMQTKYPNQILSFVDGVKTMEGAMKVFVNIASIMAIIIIIITILLIALILFILIKTVIHNNKMNLGILKAVGYTTRQLRLQTSWSLMPVVGIGVMIGAILSYLTMNNVIIILFRVLGVMKLGFLIPIPMVIITAIAMMIISFLIAFGLCGRIRKISAYELISE